MIIISVVNTKPGVGSSTIAYNLAIEFSKEFDVEVVDLDSLKTITCLTQLRNEKKNFEVLHFVNIQDFNKYLQKKEDKMIIIDVCSSSNNFHIASLLASNIILTPVTYSQVDIIGLVKFEALIEELENITHEKIYPHLLLNQIDTKKEDLSDIIHFFKKQEHFILLKSILKYRSDFQCSLSRGQSVIEFNENCYAAKEMKALVIEIKIQQSIERQPIENIEELLNTVNTERSTKKRSNILDHTINILRASIKY